MSQGALGQSGSLQYYPLKMYIIKFCAHFILEPISKQAIFGSGSTQTITVNFVNDKNKLHSVGELCAA